MPKKSPPSPHDPNLLKAAQAKTEAEFKALLKKAEDLHFDALLRSRPISMKAAPASISAFVLVAQRP
jgi:hypothetical protein